MSMHSSKAKVARYPLPSSSTMSTVLLLTNSITPLPPPQPDDTDTDGPDDPTNPDYNPPESRRQRYTSTRREESDLAKAMDELNMVLMYIHGITPEVAAERRQKKIEQEERAAQEASRSKVMEWRNHLDG